MSSTREVYILIFELLENYSIYLNQASITHTHAASFRLCERLRQLPNLLAGTVAEGVRSNDHGRKHGVTQRSISTLRRS